MSALPFGIYVIVQDLNIPLIVQPQLFALLTLLSWTQCMYYSRKRSRAWCVGVLATTMVCYAAVQVGVVFALRVSYTLRTPRVIVDACETSPRIGAGRPVLKPVFASWGS